MANSEFDDLAARLLELLDTIADLQRTLEALADHGVIIGDSITGTATDAQRVLEEARAVGVDLEDVFGVLENDGVAKVAAPRNNCSTPAPHQCGPPKVRGAGEDRTVDKPRSLNWRTAGPASLSGAAGSQGHAALQVDDDHRSQADRHDVRRRVLRVLLRRRADGAVHPYRTGRAWPAVSVQRAVQPAVHDARHGDAAVLRHPDRVRVRQPGAAAADRCPRCGVPAAECVVVLALSVRRLDRSGRLSRPRRAGRLRLDRLHPTVECDPFSGCRRGSVDPGSDRRRPGHNSGRSQHDHHRGVHARPRDDDVPDAGLHLEHPGDQRDGAGGVPAA